jgi:hypothetical protein
MWGVSITPRPLSTPRENPVPTVLEAGWAPGPVWTGAEKLAPTRIRSPDHPARSQSLYRLSYPAHLKGLRATIYQHRGAVKKAQSHFSTTVDGKTGGRNPCWGRIISGQSDTCPLGISIRDIHNLLKESLSSLLLSLEWCFLSNAFL